MLQIRNVKTSQDFLSAQPISQGDAAGGRESRNLALVAREFMFNGWWPKKTLVAHTRAIGGPGIFLRAHALISLQAVWSG
jgi:hypothetical protein